VYVSIRYPYGLNNFIKFVELNITIKLEDVIEKRTEAYYRLSENVILMIYFEEDDGPLKFIDEDKIITNLAIKATHESLEEDVFDLKWEKYAMVWYDSITLDE